MKSVLRTPEMIAAYTADQQSRPDFRTHKNYEEDEERVMRRFEHWVVIENLYPYDLIAKEHHLLVPKRVFGKMAECTRDEWNEYKHIINVLEEEAHYDVIMENFSKGRSILGHLHLHLIVYKG